MQWNKARRQCAKDPSKRQLKCMEVQLSSKSGKQVKVKASKALILSSKSAKKQLLWSKLNVLDVKEDYQPHFRGGKIGKNKHAELEKAALLEEISWT